MAEDHKSDALDELRRENPELVDGLERAAHHTVSRHRRPQCVEDSLADDYTWLYDFEYHGKKLSVEEITTILELAKNGFRLLASKSNVYSRSHVQAALHEITKNTRNPWQISSAKIGRELASILNANITDFISVEPGTNRISLKDLDSLPKEKTAAIQEVHEVRTAQGVQIRVKLYDKIAATNVAARMLDLFPKDTIKVEITGLEERLASALQRVERDAIDGECLIEDNFDER